MACSDSQTKIAFKTIQINGLRNTTDMVKFSDPQSHRPERVPASKQLLSSVTSAHVAYRQKCEKEKEENERRKEGKRERRGINC